MKLTTWEDLPAVASYVAGKVSRRYVRYGITRDDVLSEINVYLYSHVAKVRGWLYAKPSRTTRIFRQFHDVAVSYAEKEKAARVGYDPDDVAWYSPALVEALMPLALDDTFTGQVQTEDDGTKGRRGRKPANEGGDLLAMVMDVRRALDGEGLEGYFQTHTADDYELWDARIAQLVDFLGGTRVTIGRRKVLTNSAAQAITNNQEVA